MSQDKRLSLEEALDLGIIQEINRLLLHPAGFAMFLETDSGGRLRIGGIYDGREDPEGWIFAEVDPAVYKRRADAAAGLIKAREAARKARYGWVIQPTSDVGRKEA